MTKAPLRFENGVAVLDGRADQRLSLGSQMKMFIDAAVHGELDIRNIEFQAGGNIIFNFRVGQALDASTPCGEIIVKNRLRRMRRKASKRAA